MGDTQKQCCNINTKCQMNLKKVGPTAKNEINKVNRRPKHKDRYNVEQTRRFREVEEYRTRTLEGDYN